MALSKRTQVTLATVSVFLVSLVGLGVYSFSLALPPGSATASADNAATNMALSFIPATVTGKVGDKGKIIDLSLNGSDQVIAATLDISFDPQYVAITEVNTVAGILGQAVTSFDVENGVLHLAFKPGKAVTPAGRVATFIIELTHPGNTPIKLFTDTSEVTALHNGVLTKRTLTSTDESIVIQLP